MITKQIMRLRSLLKNNVQPTDDLSESLFHQPLTNIHSELCYKNEILGLVVGTCCNNEMQPTMMTEKYHKFMVLFDGNAKITNTLTGEHQTLKAGDAFILSKGLPYLWQQTKKTTTFFVSSLAMDNTPVNANRLSGIICFNDYMQGDVVEKSSPLVEVNTTGAAFNVKAGKKVNKGQHYYQDETGNFFAGIWQSDAFETKMQAFPRHEFIYIQSGALICIDENHHQHLFKSGDAFFIPQGTLCYWQVLESVCTFYAVRQT